MGTLAASKGSNPIFHRRFPVGRWHRFAGGNPWRPSSRAEEIHFLGKCLWDCRFASRQEDNNAEPFQNQPPSRRGADGRRSRRGGYRVGERFSIGGMFRKRVVFSDERLCQKNENPSTCGVVRQGVPQTQREMGRPIVFSAAAFSYSAIVRAPVYGKPAGAFFRCLKSGCLVIRHPKVDGR